MREVVVTSDLAAAPATVWARVATMDGVNAELSPWMRMTAPGWARKVRFDDAPIGEPVFRSTLLAFGWLPFDVHTLVLAALVPGQGFQERSWSLLQRAWHHDRSIEPADGGCRLTDRVAFEPRLPGTGALVAPIVTALFRARHRRLRAAFGELPTDSRGRT